MLRKFSYTRAQSIQAAMTAAARPGAHIFAGGTDLLGCLRDGILTADTVVSISGIKDLTGISGRTAGGMRIGALTTLSEVASNPGLFAQAAAAAASPQLRNQGTIGGNICQRPRCWYFRGDFHCLRKGGDTCFAVAGESEFHCIFGGGPCFIVHPSDTATALVALEAQVSIAGINGARTIPLASFFVLPADNILKENVLVSGDVVTEILLGPPRPGARSMYRKVRERGAFDFASAGAAAVVVLANGKVRAARIVLSGVAPVPWRVTAAEELLVGESLDTATVARVATAAVQDASPLSKNKYKIPLVRGVLEETLLALA
jgi:xanthine dehydrogenase YagS FAD-binding subunit